MEALELEKIIEEELMGKPFDQFRCFYIKDFNKGDSIRVRQSRDSAIVRGVVCDVDLKMCTISYRTSDSELNKTTIDKIVSLEEYIRNFLDK